MRLFDSHCHLDFADFDADRDEVLARALTRPLTPIEWSDAEAAELQATLSGKPAAGGEATVAH